MWPFREKQQAISMDEAARVISDEIKKCMEPYLETMDRLVTINNNLYELKQLIEEVSIFHISLFHYTSSVIELPDAMRNRLIPTIVGYLQVDPKLFIERSENYQAALNHVKAELAPLTVSNVLAEIINQEYSGYKEANGKIFLAETFSVFAFKSIKKLGNTTLDLQRTYKLIE